MGIHSLTNFIRENFTGWRRYEIPYRSDKMLTLVIDGLSLCHSLYEEHEKVNDILLGGDYVSFANYIRLFFDTLHDHNIKPFVMFDGIDIDFAKNETQDGRRKQDTETVEELPKLTKTKQIKGLHIKPYLLFDVMIQTVLNIFRERYPEDNHLLISVTDGNADVDIVRMAKKLKCPVLGEDSDFYVFPLPSYIPYEKFHWLTAKKDGKIIANIYKWHCFTEQFEIPQKHLLTLLPAIAGNDTIHRLQSYRKKKLPNGEALIRWAIDYPKVHAAVTCKTYKRACDIAKVISQDLYTNLQAAYEEYFGQFENPNEKESKICTELHRKFNSLPDAKRVHHRIRSGEFPKLLVDALFFQVISLRVSVEDISENWCHSIGEPVRGLVYAILHGNIVKEQQRQKGKIAYQPKDITAPSLHLDTTLPQLQNDNFTPDKGKKILYSALESNEAQFKEIIQINPDHQLLLAVTRYWYIKSELKLDLKEIFMQSFLLFLQSPFSKAKDTMAQSTVATGENSPKGFQNLFLHHIAEWQSLYYCVHCLNQLLKQPVHLLQPSKFLECSNLYSYIEAVFKDGANKVIDYNGLNEITYETYLNACNHC